MICQSGILSSVSITEAPRSLLEDLSKLTDSDLLQLMGIDSRLVNAHTMAELVLGFPQGVSARDYWASGAHAWEVDRHAAAEEMQRRKGC